MTLDKRHSSKAKSQVNDIRTIGPLVLMCTSTVGFFFLNSVLGPFQNYFSSHEMGQSVGGRKWENPEKKHPTQPQAELGLSHMWPVRGSNPHQTQR